MGRFKDISGINFGMLTALEPTDARGTDGSVVWECACKCGNISYVTSSNLKSGNTFSCGCFSRECRRNRRKYNKIEQRDGYYVGYASNTGEEFYFDECDYDTICQHTWRVDKRGYIVTDIGNTRAVRMHRLLLKDCENIIDHKNGNTRDNRRCNIREADFHKNQMNRVVGSNSLTGYKGVTYRKDRNNYFARIRINGKNKYLGTFNTIQEAIDARKKAEDEMFGEFSFNKSRGGDA